MSRCNSSLLDGFTDDWDAALLSEGTLRPKRTASAMNLRDVIKTLNKSPVGSVTKQDLENQFSRSMKLLGLDAVDSVSSKTASKPKLNNVACRTITRLEKPTVSYEDIRNAVTDVVDRKVLSQAAYERWYFRKVEEEKSRRKGFLDLDKNRSKLLEHGMAFSEWLEKKEKERKIKKSIPEKTNQEKQKIKRRLPMSSPATKEAAEKAYKEWMNKKKEEDAKKKQKMKEELEAKNAAKSREDAEKAFDEWKRSHDEKLKKTEQRKRDKERKARQKEQDEKDRHLQDCEKAFNAWLSSKNQTLQERSEKTKKQTMKKSMEEQRKLVEKRYEAKQAFEEWLEKKLELDAARPPTPEFKVTKSIQTDIAPRAATPVHKCSRQAANFPKNLMVPWASFSAKNQLTSPKRQNRCDSRAGTPRKQCVKFADSDPESPQAGPKRPVKSCEYGDFTKFHEPSDNKTLMMLYHRRDPNAMYYARDLI